MLNPEMIFNQRPLHERALILVLIVSSLAVAVFGQPSAQEKPRGGEKKHRERAVELENLINDAHSVPAEFAVDALVRIAMSGKLTDREWKRDILDEAFRLTSDVQQPVKRKVLPLRGVPVDTRPGYQSFAFDLKLDALSLRSRIINLMSDVDKPHTRELLGGIPPKLSLPPLTCEDTLVYDVWDFYETLGHVAQGLFNTEEVQGGVRLHFLLPYVQSISSPSQIAPVAKLLVTIGPSSQESLILEHSMTAALKRISGDDRSFSYSITREQLTKSIQELARAHGSKSPDNELLEAFREYLVKNLSGTRCMDNAILDGELPPRYIRDVNFLFPTKPLLSDEIKQSQTDPAPKVSLFWKSNRAERLLWEFKQLRFSSEGEGDSTAEEKATQDWQEKLTEFLTDMNAWTSAEENSELDYFHQKYRLYLSLVEMLPEGASRDRVLRGFVNDLAQQSMQQDSRIDWFLYLSDLVKSGRGSGRSRISEVLSNSNNPTLRMYAEMMKLGL